MKVQLTIKVDYLPNWDAYCGVREIIQNGKDAEVENHAPLTVNWYNDTLRVENEGTTLPLKALLLGHTTKIGNSELIGKFGEGLKLAVLALVRAGHPIKIRNGSEVWIPTIERSHPSSRRDLEENSQKPSEQKVSRLSDIPAIISSLQDDCGLANCADVVRSLDPIPAATVHEELFALYADGDIELRPESGVGLLSEEDRALCPKGIKGMALSYVRILRRK